MFDFVDVKDRLPDDGQEVEVLREVGYYCQNGYCRYAIERTTYQSLGCFTCDVCSTGIVRAWRPAEYCGEAVTANDYSGLNALLGT